MQLEFETYKDLYRYDDSFQSHIGAIRIRSGLPKKSRTAQFQSHIGAIRMSMKIILLWYIAIFQSHIGAIRIREKRRKRYMEALFQSHIGAIRICRDSFNFSQALHFNPTLVQLELNPCCNQHQHIATFQSHIGAIRIDSLFAASAREICISIPHWCN